MGRADTYSQPGAADPVLPSHLVLRLARRHLPATATVSQVVQVDESGGEARAYLLDGGVVVKVQRPQRLRPRTSLVKEAALLSALAEALGARIPTLYGVDQADTDVGTVRYLVMSRVAGRPVAEVDVRGERRGSLIQEVARVLRAVHSLDPARVPGAGLLPDDGGWAALRLRLELGFGDHLDELEGRETAWPLPIPPEHVVSRVVAGLPSEGQWRPAVLYSNPGPTHVFVGPRGGFEGIIDFGDAYRSHPALDLRAWPDPADRVALRRAYLDGEEPGNDFDAVWTAAMVFMDWKAMLRHPQLAEPASRDLLIRLADL